MYTVLEKVIAIHNIRLPYDLCEHINSFCFYDKYQIKVREWKNILHEKIKNSFSGYSYGYGYGIDGEWGQWWFQASDYNRIVEPQFQASNCIKCGNYMRSNNFNVAANRSICICILQEQTDGLYWIESESLIDPIETMYAEWREEYWNSRW